MRRIVTKPGDRFGKMTAIKRGDDYVYASTGKKAERWWWECDCGNRVLWIPAQVRYNAKKGWGACYLCKPEGWQPGGKPDLSSDNCEPLREGSTEVEGQTVRDDRALHQPK